MRKPINNETQLINEIWNRANKELNERRQLSSPSIYDPLNLDPSKADHNAHVIEYLKSKANEPTKELPQDVDPDIARLAALDPKDQEQAYNLRRMVGFGAAAMADAPHGGWSEPEEEEDTTEPGTSIFDLAKMLGWNWEDIKKKATEKKDAVTAAGDTIDVGDYQDGDEITVGIDLPKPTDFSARGRFSANFMANDSGQVEQNNKPIIKLPEQPMDAAVGKFNTEIGKNFADSVFGSFRPKSKVEFSPVSTKEQPMDAATKEYKEILDTKVSKGTMPSSEVKPVKKQTPDAPVGIGVLLEPPTNSERGTQEREKATPAQRKQVEDSAKELGVVPWSKEHSEALADSIIKNTKDIKDIQDRRAAEGKPPIPTTSSGVSSIQTTSGRETGMGQGKTAVQPTRTWDEVAAEYIPDRFKNLPITRRNGKVYAGDVEMTAASEAIEGKYTEDSPSRKQIQEQIFVNRYSNYITEMARRKKATPSSETGADSLFGSQKQTEPKTTKKTEPKTKRTKNTVIAPVQPVEPTQTVINPVPAAAPVKTSTETKPVEPSFEYGSPNSVKDLFAIGQYNSSPTTTTPQFTPSSTQPNPKGPMQSSNMKNFLTSRGKTVAKIGAAASAAVLGTVLAITNSSSRTATTPSENTTHAATQVNTENTPTTIRTKIDHDAMRKKYGVK